VWWPDPTSGGERVVLDGPTWPAARAMSPTEPVGSGDRWPTAGRRAVADSVGGWWWLAVAKGGGGL
jgi:hypothetical protein